IDFHAAIVATRREQRLHVSEFGYAFFALGVTPHNRAEIGNRFRPGGTARHSESQYLFNRGVREFSTLGEITAFVETPLAEQQANTFRAKLVELVDSAQHIEAPCSIALAFQANCIQHAVENLAVIDADYIIPAPNAKTFQRISHHHAHFGISRYIRCAHRVCVELHKLAETARTRVWAARSLDTG